MADNVNTHAAMRYIHAVAAAYLPAATALKIAAPSIANGMIYNPIIAANNMSLSIEFNCVATMFLCIPTKIAAGKERISRERTAIRALR